MEAPNHQSEAAASGESPSVDELNAAPEPTNILHESPEELLSDKSTHPEGVRREHADPREVEPMADVHEPQADGDSSEDDPGVDPVEDTIIDGRISGPPPSYADDTTDDPSAVEGEIQAEENEDGE